MIEPSIEDQRFWYNPSFPPTGENENYLNNDSLQRNSGKTHKSQRDQSYGNECNAESS